MKKNILSFLFCFGISLFLCIFKWFTNTGIQYFKINSRNIIELIIESLILSIALFLVVKFIEFIKR